MCALQGEESQKAAEKPQSLAQLLSHTGLARKEDFCWGKGMDNPTLAKRDGSWRAGRMHCTLPSAHPAPRFSE